MASGEVLRVVTTDRNAIRDFQALPVKPGMLVAQEEAEGRGALPAPALASVPGSQAVGQSVIRYALLRARFDIKRAFLSWRCAYL